MKRNNPPILASFILKLIAFSNDRTAILGDIEEDFHFNSLKRGRIYANFVYWKQVFRSFVTFLKYYYVEDITMFSNYIKITLRNISKHKGYSFINITGLAIGMACCLFISLWALDELSYDRFNENANRLYKVVLNNYYSSGLYKTARTCAPLAPALKSGYPEVAGSTRYRAQRTMLVKYKDKAFYETEIITADPELFSMFTFPFIKGEKSAALENPNSVVITAEIAEKYFGNENPIGRPLTFNNEDDYIVTGVIKNVPRNSHMDFNIVIPWSYMNKMTWYNENEWTSNFLETYVLLNDPSDEEALNEKIRYLVKEHSEVSVTEFYLQPLTDIHLYSSFYGNTGPGDIVYVYIFTVIAVFVLLIACINFMNLSTARSANRAKEIGLRKVAGAMRPQIIRQFYSESIVMSFIALALALVIVVFLLPQFNTLSGKQISLINTLHIGNLLIGLFSVTMFTGLIAGSYPALYLSSFQPVQVLRGKLSAGTKNSNFRRVLVVLQFSLSIFLITGTMIIFSQLKFMKNMDLGWDKEQLLYLNMRGESLEKYPVLKEELLKDSRIIGVSATQSLPSGFGNSSTNMNWEGKDPDQTLYVYFTSVDYNFTETLDIGMAEGRSFSKEFTSDTSNAILINEEFKRIIGKESVVGMSMTWGTQQYNVIGVTNDFHAHSARTKMEPAIMYLSTRSLYYTLIRVSPENIGSTVSFIEDTWNSVIPDYPIDYHFFEERFDRMYRADSRMGQLLSYFSVLAVLIASLGLFGLASFVAEQRTKEIGIRKVLGASVTSIVKLLSKEFVVLVTIANIIACPAAWYLMDKWLMNFAYRISIEWYVFGIAGISTLIVALLVVSYKTMKAALAVPVDSLKYE